ncbi:MAG: response regulator transcription factor [Myxococcota bacterium]|nr:response regulator transcription factor [Myxococcota bacterium]
MSTCKILMIDDHPLVRDGLRMILSSQEDLRVIGEGGSCAEARVLLSELDVDLLLLDIQLPDGNGFELTQRLREEHPGLKVVMISAQDETLYGGWSLHFGADGMINKGAEPAQICALVRKAWRGEPAFSEATRHWSLQLLRGELSEGTHRLTAREFSVFFQIGAGHNSKEIADQLSISPRTVETYHRKIREKLALPHHDALIRLAAHLFSGGETQSQIKAEMSLLKSFELRELREEDWTHRAHLIVAFQYLSRYPFKRALNLIQTGIKRLNESYGDDSAYHETVTVAFATLIKDFLNRAPVWLHAKDFLDHHSLATSDDSLEALSPYYSLEILESDEARRCFIEPDLKALPSVEG